MLARLYAAKFPVDNTQADLDRTFEEIEAARASMGTLLANLENPRRRELAVSVIQGLKDYRCLLYTSPSPRDRTRSRLPSSA